MARMNKAQRLSLVNHFALGAHFVAREDMRSARMHAEIAFRVLQPIVPELLPKCPDEPKPAEPECDHECHRRPWNFYSWKFCPRCGGALKQEG